MSKEKIDAITGRIATLLEKVERQKVRAKKAQVAAKSAVKDFDKRRAKGERVSREERAEIKALLAAHEERMDAVRATRDKIAELKEKRALLKKKAPAAVAKKPAVVAKPAVKKPAVKKPVGKKAAPKLSWDDDEEAVEVKPKRGRPAKIKVVEVEDDEDDAVEVKPKRGRPPSKKPESKLDWDDDSDGGDGDDAEEIEDEDSGDDGKDEAQQVDIPAVNKEPVPTPPPAKRTRTGAFILPKFDPDAQTTRRSRVVTNKPYDDSQILPKTEPVEKKPEPVVKIPVEHKPIRLNEGEQEARKLPTIEIKSGGIDALVQQSELESEKRMQKNLEAVNVNDIHPQDLDMAEMMGNPALYKAAHSGNKAAMLKYIAAVYKKVDYMRFGNHLQSFPIKFVLFKHVSVEKFRMRGEFDPMKREIRISPNLFGSGHEAHIVTTIVHEMCHQAVFDIDGARGARWAAEGGHGPEWRAQMLRMPLEPSRFSKYDNKQFMSADMKKQMEKRKEDLAAVKNNHQKLHFMKFRRGQPALIVDPQNPKRLLLGIILARVPNSRKALWQFATVGWKKKSEIEYLSGSENLFYEMTPEHRAAMLESEVMKKFIRHLNLQLPD